MSSQSHPQSCLIQENISMMSTLTADIKQHETIYGSQPRASYVLPSGWKWVSLSDCDGVGNMGLSFYTIIKGCINGVEHICHFLSKRSSRQLPLQVRCSLVFCSAQGVLLLNMLGGGTIIAAQCCQSLLKLKKVICNKQISLPSGLILLDDSARPLLMRATQNILQP